MSIAFLFPGQGSQEIGMGQDLFKADTHFKNLVALASDLTHEDLEKLCLRGPEKKLRSATYLQPLLTAVSLGYLRHVRDAGIIPRVVLGHSLGEITALAASGVVTDQEAVQIAAKRGELMDNAAKACAGSMVAALIAPLASVVTVLAEMNMPQHIVLANDNAPDQVVVSGDNDVLAQFMRIMGEKKIGRCKQLAVSGPWHSPFMTTARDLFSHWVKAIPFKSPAFPLLMNATAKEETDSAIIKALITDQLIKPVYWRDCMKSVASIPITTFLEIGPGRVLSGLVRVNGFPTDTVIYNVNNLVGFERAKQELAK
jgi:[acyl-carrier-protein] S-malonyltransferase